MRIWHSADGADWLSGVWITWAGSDRDASQVKMGKMGAGPDVVGDVGVRLDSPSESVSMFTSISE